MRRVGLLLAAFLAIGALTAAAPQTTLNAVEAELMCDTCRVPLPLAESARADQERNEIRALIAKGLTKQQILDVFEKTYGPNILADPKGSSGASIAVYVVPPVAILAVLIGLLLALPRWRRRRAAQEEAAAGEAPPPELDADDQRRLDDDIARYDL